MNHAKLEDKFKTQYSELGHVPGISVPSSQRSKVLKEIGVIS
jgi:hypothetical protein